MKHTGMILTVAASILVGILYYALQNRLIIIQLPLYRNYYAGQQSRPASKKVVTLYYWDNGTFKHEDVTIISSENRADTVRYVVTSWLAVLEQSGLLPHKTCLESIALSASGNVAYISWERTILGKNESTFEKWMRIEGLLKTMRVAQLGLASVHFLVNHRPLSDAHLDFSNPWPINGFVES